MIPRPRPERFRLRRTMIFMSAQKPGLIKDAYIYGVDSVKINIVDKGALDCTLKARVECAVFRSCDASEKDIPWGGAVS